METVSSTTVLTTPGNLTSTMQIYYDRVFLERSMMAKRYDYLAGSKKVPKNSGKVVYFNRMTAYTPTTTALTEGATPTGVNSTSSIVSGTLASYGSFEQISTLFQMTSIDAGLKELTENFGQFAGESMDTYLRNIMFAGATDQFAGSNTKLTGIATSNVLSVTELRKAVLTLKTNKAPTFESGMYRGVISAHGIYNLQGDTTAGNWLTVNAATSRQNSEEIKRG